MRPPGERILIAAPSPVARLPSSSLTSMRMAWKVRVAGWMSLGQAALGMAFSTAAARSLVVVSGRRRTTKSAIRDAQRSSPRLEITRARSR